jgi:hypothetical protein
VVTLLGHAGVAAPGTCAQSFQESYQPPMTSIDGRWHPGSEDPLSAFRANAPHYWAWLRETQRSPLFQINGLVIGDGHQFNFSEIPLSKGGRKFGLVDLDDSGLGSLFGDFLRLAISNQISPWASQRKQIWQEYVSGLSGQATTKPEPLKDIESLSDKDFEKEQKKYVDALTKKNHFSKQAGLMPIDSAPNGVQKLFLEARGLFAKEIQGKKILDIGYKVKTDGGSQGFPRFWYLVEENNSQHIYEFKMLKEPAVSLFVPQENFLTRFARVAMLFRPNEKVEGPYRVVETPRNKFLMRERFTPELDYSPKKVLSPKGQREAEEMFLYLVHRLGVWHAKQPAGIRLLNSIDQTTNAENIFDEALDSYIQKMKIEENRT